MRGPRTSAEKVVSCAVGAVAVWFLTIAVGFSPRHNLPTTVGMAVFEVAWLSFPGLIVGAFWAARGAAGRFPAFTAVVTAVGMVVAAHGFDLQADPLAALTVVFAPLYLGCLALGAIVLTLLGEAVQRRRTRPRLVPPPAASRQGPPGPPDASP
jgi:Na+(H+)/acetate symporter ActP